MNFTIVQECRNITQSKSGCCCGPHNSVCSNNINLKIKIFIGAGRFGLLSFDLADCLASPYKRVSGREI